MYTVNLKLAGEATRRPAEDPPVMESTERDRTGTGQAPHHSVETDPIRDKMQMQSAAFDVVLVRDVLD